MRVISLLRSAVAGPRQRPVGALAILTVIVGVVTMHSMSGSPTSHSHHAPHETSAVAIHDGAAAMAMTQRVPAPSIEPAEIASAQVAAIGAPMAASADTAGEPGSGVCHDGCGGHDLATAMCLMILVAILALVVPARRLLWLAPPERSLPPMPAPAGLGAVVAPSLHELCISRT